MKLLSFFLCCLPILLNAKADTIVHGVKFEQTLTWEQIKAKARASNKYIFVDCYATWCGPCKKMDKEVYPSPEVGAALNDYFISVKVQMDSTTRDSEQTKKWYSTAHNLLRDYKIPAFPTLLFFSPDGQLVQKELGFKDASELIVVSRLARDPQKLLYYSQYEHYKQNKKTYPTMGKLAIFTRDIIGDSHLASKMAKDYKENYLDNQEARTIYTKEDIDFVMTFDRLISSTDKFFALAYEQPQRFDSITGFPGDATGIVTKTIYQDEIAPKILKNGKALTRLPDWDGFEESLAKKYTLLDVHRLVLNYKINYYKDNYIDWELWAKYKDEMIKSYPPKPPYDLEVYMEINGFGGAWHAFLHCPDKAVLSKALEWVDLAIELDSNDKHKRAAYLDTKANLLYKLGKKEEALKLQKDAIELLLNSKDSELLENYAKMQRGEPTWSNK